MNDHISLFPHFRSLSLKSMWVFILLAMGWMHSSTLAMAQQQQLVVEDTMTTMFVINPDLPHSASVVLYSPLPNLAVHSSIGFLDTSFKPEKGEYILSISPSSAHKMTIEYPGFKTHELWIPPIDKGESRSYIVRPPDYFVKGMLVVEATPEDARILVDGVELGQGTIQVALCPGEYPVRISKEGYESLEFSAQISLEEANIQRRAITLARQPMSVTSNVEGARVFFQGQEIGVTPLSDFMVDQGLAEIRVETPGYTSFTQMVDIRNDRTNVIEANLETQIQVLPSTSVYVQNESASIEGDILQITYDLAPEKRKYHVNVVFLGTDNQPIEVTGLQGDLGRNQMHGSGRTIYWPIPESLSMNELKVQIDVKAKESIGWFLLGGGLSIGSGVAIAVLSGGNDGGGGGGGRGR